MTLVEKHRLSAFKTSPYDSRTSHRNLDMTSHYENETVPCSISLASQCLKIRLVIDES